MRRRKTRRISGVPKVFLLGSGEEQNILTLDEAEALRLRDLEGLELEDAAKEMGISRRTFSRILKSGREKLVEALFLGKSIRVEGGEVMMKIAVSVSSDDENSVVLPVVGRAPGFIIYEVEGNEIKGKQYVQNPNVGAFRGAGVGTAQLLSSQGVNVVISGQVGPNAYGLMRSSGIRIYNGSGRKVREAVEAFLKGELTEITSWRGFGRGAGRGFGRGRRWI